MRISLRIVTASLLLHGLCLPSLWAQTPFIERLKAQIDQTEAALVAPKQRIVSELEPARAKTWQELEKLAPAADGIRNIDRERRQAMNDLKLMDVSKLTTRAQLDGYDKLVAHRAKLERDLELAMGRRHAQVLETARSSAEGRVLVEKYQRIEEQLRAAYGELDALNEKALAAKNRLKHYTAAPPPPGRVAGDGSMLRIRPPANAAARLERFSRRNDLQNLAQLSKHFFERIDLSAPGLEKIRPLLAAGEHGKALDAWRDAFLLRLREPQKHGLPPNWGGDLDTASLLRLPVKARLDEAMQNIFSTPRAKAQVGQPGAINWGDPGPDPHADPARNPHLDFYTMRGQMGFVDVVGPHLVLLEGYAATGEKKYLDRWCQVIDDWAMNAPADMEANPFNIRQYPVLCSFRPVALASTLTDVIDAQPQFALELPAPTLARLMLTVMEEYPASFIRLARRGIYNWRCIAMTGSVLTAQTFPEFHVARWQLDEARKLMELNWTHKILRDGSNLEQGNWGHEPNDQVHLGRAYRLLETQSPVWFDDAWRDEWRDNVKVNARYYLHALKPDGYSYRFSRVHNGDKLVKRGRFDDPQMPIQVNLLTDEPEAMRRLQWVFGDHLGQQPQVFSESLAYSGSAFLRGSWEPDASFLYLQSNPNLDCNGREDANGFAYHSHGHALLLAPPLAVDDRTQNIHHGLVPHPGGKTIWLTCDHRNAPVDARFHASQHFDFTEGKYQGVYQWITGPEAQMFGDYGYLSMADKQRSKGDEPIRDVAHDRQVLSVRGEEFIIVTDRFTSDQPRRFAQNYTLFTPVPREGWKQRIELMSKENRPPLVIDNMARSLRTDNGSLPGLSLHHISQASPTYTLLENSFTKVGQADTPDEVLATQGSKKLKKWTMGLPLPFYQKVRAEWKTHGPQVILTALASRPGEAGAAPFAGDLRSIAPILSDHHTGLRAVTGQGTIIEYLAAHQSPGSLKLGDVSIDGEALLLATDGQGNVRGIALGAVKFLCRNKAVDMQGDFEFSLTSDRLHTLPIHRPIQPVSLSPLATVFDKSVNVELACPTPGTKIHYTLDGSDPTPDSPRYDKPIVLTTTTRIKARAFRQGITKAPWTADSTHASAISWTTYQQQPLIVPAAVAATTNGLRWEYLQGRWAQLLSDVERMEVLKTGSSEKLVDVSMRATDGAFAVRSHGYLDVPADGIYTFHAPRHWQFPDNEPGYDIRLTIHAQEWQPATRRHAQGTWSIPLKKGMHPIRITFIDMRPRKHKFELWDNFPNPAIVWTGSVPTLEVEGPGIDRQPIPQSWLKH